MARDPRLQRMLEDIEMEVRLTRDHTGRDALAPRVMEAIATVPRHRFVPEGLADRAYDNGPLPVGHGQTISQPFIVALMTDLLEVGPDATVLEVGTGSGYQAAVLAEVAGRVYSIEVVESLEAQARAVLAELGYSNVETRLGDGYAGWPEHAPFDGILVTAAAPEVPPALVEQLGPGARLVIPVGNAYWGQDLRVIEKDADGHAHSRSVLPVAFVPLVHRAGDDPERKPAGP